MNAQQARLGQFVSISTTGQIVEINGNMVRVEVFHPGFHDKKWVVPVPWSAVEPMSEKELLDDPTIINGA